MARLLPACRSCYRNIFDDDRGSGTLTLSPDSCALNGSFRSCVHPGRNGPFIFSDASEFRRIAASMTPPLLTAAMIVRDEAARLPACLFSLDRVVDELVVVDTGSTDDTVPIARAHGARVFYHAWADDFSAPRNVSLQHASGRWILCIDADERLRPTDPDRLRVTLRAAEEVALLVRLRPYARSTPSWEYRLWRNDPRIRFRNVVHNRVIDAIHAVAAVDGRGIGTCDLTLDHVGFEGDQTAKHRRNLPLLEAQLAAEPEDVFNWCHLGRVLRGLGRTGEAMEALERAVALARLAPSAAGGVAWADLVKFRHERGDEVTALLAEGRALFPDNWFLVWIEGSLHLAAKRHARAIACFHRLLNVDIDAPQPVVYDERLFRAWPLHSLGTAMFHLGDYARAAEFFARAERLEPQVAEYRVKRQLAESRAATAGARIPGEADLSTCSPA